MITFSVMGDSISSFEGTSPENYAVAYPMPDSGVYRRDDMWWAHFERLTGNTMICNDSYSGSRVSETGSRPLWSAFVSDSRIARLKGDAVIVFGGTNDFGQRAEGAAPLAVFEAAYTLLIKKIRKALPHAVADFCVPPARFGLHGEFFASGRLDNLSSTHAGLTAMEDLADGNDLVIFAAFDHEEIGSATSSGAAGPFLGDVLERIAAVAGLGLDATKALLARGSCISADAGHLVHPNYPQHHDPRAQLVPGGGPMLKVNASQRYATDAVGEALWLRACEAAGVPSQVFVSNNAMPCGSTIGPITATRLGIATVDVGIGLLSMHSAREMCGADDPHHLAGALRAYLAG